MSEDSFESQKEALRNFLLDTESLDKLDHYADTPNIFRILSIEQMEIRHSNFLAWLLDPAGNHKLGDRFLKQLLFSYALNIKSGDLDVFDIDRMDLDDAIVYRELYHMDIIVQSEQSDFVLVIENKVKAGENRGQTTGYRKNIEEIYGTVKNRYFIFLTLDQSEPEDSQWVPMSYSQIVAILDPLVALMPKEGTARMYVKDYLEVTKDMAGNEDSDLKKLCREIYSKHKKAIDILIENIPDYFQKRADIIRDILGEMDGVVLRKSNNSYVRFTTPLIIEKVGLLGTGEWTPEKDLLLFEIVNNRKGNQRIVATIGPAEDPVKRDILCQYFASKFKIRSRNSEKWSRIYSKSFRLDEDKDEEEQLRKKLTEFVKETIPREFNPKIEDFPGY